MSSVTKRGRNLDRGKEGTRGDIGRKRKREKEREREKKRKREKERGKK